MKLHSALILSAFIAANVSAEQTQETTSAQTEAAAASQAETASAETSAQGSSEQAATGSVARSSFTTAIQDREPTDNISSSTTDTQTVYFFTELKDLQDQNVTHRWEYNGEVMADVKFNVGGSRWRVWSSKQFQQDWVGSWKVSVINGSGEIINTQQFEYQQAAAAPEVANTTSTEALTSEPAGDTTE